VPFGSFGNIQNKCECIAATKCHRPIYGPMDFMASEVTAGAVTYNVGINRILLREGSTFQNYQYISSYHSRTYIH